jgi:predicted PurR-regulated permease PerM
MSKWNDTEQLITLQRQLMVVLLVLLVMFCIFQTGIYFADLLRILIISLIGSYLFISAVDFLDRYLRNRVLAIAIVYLVIIAAGALAGFILIPAIVYQVTSLVSSIIDRLPELLQSLNEALMPLQRRFHERMMDIKIIDILTNFVAQVPKPDPAALISRVTDVALTTMTWSMYVVSISVITFYFLLDGYRIKESIIRVFPTPWQAMARQVAADVDHSLQAFFKGQIVLGAGFGATMLVVYVICQVPYALLLGVFLGICEILPVIGPPIGFFPAVVAVAVQGSGLPGNKLVQILLLTAIFAILQQVKDSIVAPKYMGNVIGMHPVMIVVAIMVGARVDGVLGIILALPVACVIAALVGRLHDKHGAAEVVSVPNVPPGDASAGSSASG